MVIWIAIKFFCETLLVSYQCLRIPGERNFNAVCLHLIDVILIIIIIIVYLIVSYKIILVSFISLWHNVSLSISISSTAKLHWLKWWYFRRIRQSITFEDSQHYFYRCMCVGLHIYWYSADVIIRIQTIRSLLIIKCFLHDYLRSCPGIILSHLIYFLIKQHEIWLLFRNYINAKCPSSWNTRWLIW